MKPLTNTIKAIIRRFVTIAVSGIAAFAFTQWPSWTEQAVNADKETAYLWPFIYFVIEFAQKLIRESRNDGTCK